jgi:hypothetical protein
MVEKKDMHTYDNGFDFNLLKTLTKDGVVKICRALEKRFGEGNVFAPEGVGGGFIEWVDWPGRDGKKAYKCMRQWRRDHGHATWPWVSEDAKTEWVGNEDVALEDGKYGTFLKAFYAATEWTPNELRIVKECLENADCKVLRIPALGEKAEQRP